MDLSLVLPFYNEEACAEKVISSLYHALSERKNNFELILVNNGSEDKTGEILKKFASKYQNVKIVEIKKNEGYGWGIINGLKNCEGDYVGFLAGDGQVSPEDVLKVFTILRNNANFDYAKVNRVKREDGLTRKIISKAYNFLFFLIFGFYEVDVNGTPKIFKKEVLKKIDLKSKDWFIDAEFIIKARRQKLKGLQIPIVFKPREKGKSHVKLSSIIEFVKNMIRYRLKPW